MNASFNATGDRCSGQRLDDGSICVVNNDDTDFTLTFFLGASIVQVCCIAHAEYSFRNSSEREKRLQWRRNLTIAAAISVAIAVVLMLLLKSSTSTVGMVVGASGFAPTAVLSLSNAQKGIFDDAFVPTLAIALAVVPELTGIATNDLTLTFTFLYVVLAFAAPAFFVHSLASFRYYDSTISITANDFWFGIAAFQGAFLYTSILVVFLVIGTARGFDRDATVTSAATLGFWLMLMPAFVSIVRSLGKFKVIPLPVGNLVRLVVFFFLMFGAQLVTAVIWLFFCTGMISFNVGDVGVWQNMVVFPAACTNVDVTSL